MNIKHSTYYRWRENLDTLKQVKPIREGVILGYSYRYDGTKISDLEIQKIICTILSDEFGKYYGYKKITMTLKNNYKIRINKKKVYRLMSVLGLLKLKKPKARIFKRICKTHKITESNKLWEMDTKYVYIAEIREVAYLASIIDVFDRSIISCVLSSSPNAESAKKALIEALYKRGLKDNTDGLIIRTDNGSQFTAYEFEKLCIKEKVIHERIPVNSPNHNAHIESYHRRLQDECLAGRLFKDSLDAETTIMKYVNGYNTIRIHSSIGYRTPEYFYNLKNDKFKDKLVVSL